MRAFFLTGSKRGVNRFSNIKARSSGGERYLDTVEVVGSNPIVPTSEIKGLRVMAYPLFCCLLPGGISGQFGKENGSAGAPEL